MSNNETLCARCGKPAKGWAMIDGERYCHEGTGASCYMQASWKLAQSGIWPPNSDKPAVFTPDMAYAEGYRRGKQAATQEIIEWLRAYDIEPLKVGEQPVCGNLVVEGGAISMIADAIEKGIHND